MRESDLSDGVLYTHWTDAGSLPWPWPNFTPEELASNGSGEFYWHTRTFIAIQRARYILGLPLHINSAHRDWLHNIAIGGAPLSAHLFIALDVSTRGHDRVAVYKALKEAGFTSFGFYSSFIHADLRPGRSWYGSEASRKIWAPLLANL